MPSDLVYLYGLYDGEILITVGRSTLKRHEWLQMFNCQNSTCSARSYIDEHPEAVLTVKKLANQCLRKKSIRILRVLCEELQPLYLPYYLRKI